MKRIVSVLTGAAAMAVFTATMGYGLYALIG